MHTQKCAFICLHFLCERRENNNLCIDMQYLITPDIVCQDIHISTLLKEKMHNTYLTDR